MHEASRKLRKRLDELSGAMASERKRLAATYAVEYDVAKARFDELSSGTAKLTNGESIDNKVSARLRVTLKQPATVPVA